MNGGHRLVNIDAGNYTYKIAAVSLAGNGSYTPLMYFVIPPKMGELCFARGVGCWWHLTNHLCE